MRIKKYKQLAITLFFLVLGTVSLQAQDTLKLSLIDARRLALENNNAIKNSAIDLKIAQKKIKEVVAIGLPQVDTKANYQYVPSVPSIPANMFDPNGDPNETIELGVKQNVTYDLTVSQLIFNGAYIVGLQGTKVLSVLSQQRYEKTTLDINEVVINNYYLILVAEESQKILNQNLANVNKTLYEITEQNKQGFVEKTDVDQLELTANTIQNALSQIAVNLEMSYRLMKIYLGIDNNQNIKLIDVLGSGDALDKAVALLNETFIIDQNIDYQLINSAEKVAKLEYNRERTNYLPLISSFYMHQDKINKPFFDFAPKDIIGINLSLPIFSSGMRSAMVTQKKLALEKAYNDKLYTTNNLYMAAEQYRSDLRIKIERYYTQKKSKELADVIYLRTLEKYREGVSTSMDLMNSQNQYLNNLTNFYQSIFDMVTAKSKLEKHYNINQNLE
jgi:outer membrane protein